MYFSGSAASDYDAAPYNVAPAPILALDNVLAAARATGHSTQACDVLDLGCGFGHQLAQASDSAKGRLVGVDASQVTCEGAREVLSPWAERAEIIHGRFEDVEPRALGTFDVIYCVGALYTLPTEARDVLLKTMGECLRPGGLAIMTYYAGTRGLIHNAVALHLRKQQTGDCSAVEAIARARSNLAELQKFQGMVPHISAVAEHVQGIGRYDDVTLLHEVFGHGIQLQSTRELNDALQFHQVSFLSYLSFNATTFDGNALERVHRAETLDLLNGGYRYSIFARAPD